MNYGQCLRTHTFRQVVRHRSKLLRLQLRDERSPVTEVPVKTVDVRQIYEFLGPDRPGESAGHSIRVDVHQDTRDIGGNRSYDRSEPAVQKTKDDVRADGGDLADPAEVLAIRTEGFLHVD